MDCGRARELNLDGLRERLSAATKAELEEHLSTCVRCRAHAEAERVLSEVLESLPQHAAPLALKRRLAESWPSLATGTLPRPTWTPRWAALATAAAALVIVVAGSTSLFVELFVEQRAALRQLEGESINDHLRVLEGAPLARVTGGLHEVKPWFGGKLDFAPAVHFAGNDDFPLEGGAVEPFLDRRAAVFVYKRRLHTASLFVVPSEGLAFPPELRTQTVRGFHVALWQQEGQGYALVSDLDMQELLELQAQIAAR